MNKDLKKLVECSQKVINYSSISFTDRFDKPNFDKDLLLYTLEYNSPKLITLLANIKKLDASDYNNNGKLYKHYIYSSVSKGYGSKIIASTLLAAGYTMVNVKKGSSISLSKTIIDSKDESKFAVLSSTALWNTSVSPKTTKEVLETFNKRPENIYGDQIRIIILDSGFKEGVDLYDVKYCHLFEDQLNESDTIQAQGRALRFKGQCGLPFNNGWVLHVYNYILVSVKKGEYFGSTSSNIIKDIQKSNDSVMFNLNFKKSLGDIVKKSSIDYNLNLHTPVSYFKAFTNTNFFSKITDNMIQAFSKK